MKHEESEGPWPEDGHVCLECWQRWPCDATKLLDHAHNLHAVLNGYLTRASVEIIDCEFCRSLE